MFKIEISTLNDAFDAYPAEEVARILRALADKLDRDPNLPGHVALHDVNGNRVGFATNWTAPRDESPEGWRVADTSTDDNDECRNCDGAGCRHCDRDASY